MLLYGGDAGLPHKFHDLWELEIREDMPVQMMQDVANGKNPKAQAPQPDTP